MKTKIMLMLLIFVLSIGTTFGAYKVGDHINDFSLFDCDGNRVNLYDFEGKVIFINFWGNT